MTPSIQPRETVWFERSGMKLITLYRRRLIDLPNSAFLRVEQARDPLVHPCSQSKIELGQMVQSGLEVDTTAAIPSHQDHITKASPSPWSNRTVYY